MTGNILLVWDRMGDYHRARWRAMQEINPGVTVYGADLGASDSLYKWTTTFDQPSYFLLSPKEPATFDVRRLFRFLRIVRRKNINTVCIAGYGRPEYVLMIVVARLLSLRVILFAESWYPSSRMVTRAKAAFLRVFCDGFLVSGLRARQHFTQHLSVEPLRVRMGYSVVDNAHFNCEQTPARYAGKRLLCIARFSPEKNLTHLISSFAASSMPAGGWTLTIVGGGPLRRELMSMASDSVKLSDWRSYQELPLLYAEASAFVLPSSFEPWGLVVNEAMASGLPLVLSTAVGALPDLLIEGENGWCFDHASQNELTRVLNQVSHLSAEQLARAGRRSREIVSAFTPETFARNLTSLATEASLHAG